MFKKVLLAFWVIPAVLLSLQESELAPLEPIQATFSSSFHNRIVFEEARVVQAISTARGVELKPDECSGQMFLTTNGKKISNALISFILDTGVVQDVLLDFVPQPSEVLFVRCCSIDLEEGECGECFDIRDPSQIKAIVQESVKGVCPSGFESLPFQAYRRNLCKGVVLHRVGKFGREGKLIYLYEISSSRSVKLSEEDLCHEGGIWVYLEQNKICPGEKVLALVAVDDEVRS